MRKCEQKYSNYGDEKESLAVGGGFSHASICTLEPGVVGASSDEEEQRTDVEDTRAPSQNSVACLFFPLI